ncbi:TRIM71 [Branchiostoma lanceolatum]|uniref:TRIM71 protein n=1 Tax=Branchiostoma lanceolatum TaxID=7740 RepID=A0A8J9ZQB9_BRALA|nr:TRIM71 [Branchiostoma lanceolatum]
MDTINKTSDDSASSASDEKPHNMEATLAGLPHIIDSSASTTTEPVNQRDTQPQPHWIPTNPEEQTDISTRHMEDPFQNTHSVASAEHSDKGDKPGCNPDNGVERPSLPTGYSSDINITKTKQNQTLYGNNPPIETEESPSKDIYDTEGCNATNEVQYQLKDACRVKEAIATSYQRSGHVNDASVDRPDVKAEDVDQDGTQQETANKQSKDADSSDQKNVRNTAVSEDRYTTNGKQKDDFDVEPYAVTYDELDEQNQTSTGRSADKTQRACGQPDTSAEPVDGKMGGLHPNPMYQGNVLRPNPMYGGNVLRPNPMYAQNAAQPGAGAGHRCDVYRCCLVGIVTTAVATLTVLAVLIIGSFMPGEQDNTMLKARNENEDFEQATIVFGGSGEEPGKFSEPSAVVVSPGNEIFVADTSNRRVQVFNMKGVYLRHFPAAVFDAEPDTTGKVRFNLLEIKLDTMEPTGISIDGEGHVWVVGETVISGSGSVICRYTKMGDHLTTLRPSLPNNTICGIAVDTARNHVVVTELWEDYGEVQLFSLDGTVVRKFRMQQGSRSPGLVAVGREGNLFVADFWNDHRLYAYNNTCHYLFSFDDDEDIRAGAICTDSSGNVLVTNWYRGTVELFGQDGRHVRRVASDMLSSVGVGVGPGGQLVVTSSEEDTVTIFPNY